MQYGTASEWITCGEAHCAEPNDGGKPGRSRGTMSKQDHRATAASNPPIQIAPSGTGSGTPNAGTALVGTQRDGIDSGTRVGARARMPIQVEPHGLVSQARRFSADDPAQFAFELTYPTDGGTATWRVTADNDAVVILSSGGEGGAAGTEEVTGAGLQRLPGPLAHDLLVVIGEDANERTRGRRWDVERDSERTFEWSLTELLGRVRQIPGGQTRQTLRDTLVRLARLRIVASGGAGRIGRRRAKTTVVTGLFDRLEITEEPGETRVRLTVSRDLAQQFAEDFRLLETARYWEIDSGPARRLYRLLDWAAYSHDTRGTGQLRVPVHFLRDRVPINETKTHQIVRKLDAMHAELVAAGFLIAPPAYVETLAEDLRRFPTYPGKRAKLVSAVYQIAPDALASGGPASKVSGESSAALDASKRALLASLGVSLQAPTTRSELHDRVLAVQQLCGDRGNVGLYTALCKALPAEAYDRVVATVRADRPQVPRAAFVRLARDELRRHGLEIPAAANDRRLLVALLSDAAS